MPDYVTSRGTPELSRWSFTGARRENTSDGRLWLSLARDGNECSLTLYRDPQRSLAVATGVGDVAGPLELVPVGESGLSGQVELAQPASGLGELDVFYACDADLTALARDLPAQLVEGSVAGGTGFSVPCARAKRLLDALLGARLGGGFRVDSLAPLASAASMFALSFLYEWLVARPDDAASALSARFAAQGRAALPALRLMCDGRALTPFASRAARG